MMTEAHSQKSHPVSVSSHWRTHVRVTAVPVISDESQDYSENQLKQHHLHSNVIVLEGGAASLKVMVFTS